MPNEVKIPGRATTRPPVRPGIDRVVAGAIGLSKAALHVDRADEVVIRKPLPLCRLSAGQRRLVEDQPLQDLHLLHLSQDRHRFRKVPDWSMVTSLGEQSEKRPAIKRESRVPCGHGQRICPRGHPRKTAAGREREEAKALLAGKLLEGLDSGKPIPFTDGHFKAKKRALAGRAGKSRGP